MFVFVELGGHQHKLSKDMIFLCEKTPHAVGSEFLCSKVLLKSEGDKIEKGQPFVKNAQVKLRVLEDLRAPKIHGFKYKKRKGYSRRWGHRQKLQKLQVLALSA